MDRRTQRTRGAIYEAFSTLLQTKKYSQITIQEIIDTANVGRSTFYAHFAAKEELLRAICTEIFDHIFHYAPLPQALAPGEAGEEELRRMFEHILLHLGRNQKMLKGILASESSTLFIQYFKEYMGTLVDRYFLEPGRGCPAGVSPDFFKNYVSGGFVEAVKWWVKNDLNPAAQEMARQYGEMLFPVLRQGSLG